jgi:hypothetical protein
MAISLRDDAALCWPAREDHSARLSLPSKQRVAGSNPAGRADLRERLILGRGNRTTALTQLTPSPLQRHRLHIVPVLSHAVGRVPASLPRSWPSEHPAIPASAFPIPQTPLHAKR